MRAARSECQSHCSLTLSCNRTHQQQVRNIGTGDEEHKHDRTHENWHASTRASHGVIRKCHDANVATTISFGKLFLRPFSNRMQLGLRLTNRGPRLQQTYDSKVVALSIVLLFSIEDERCPHHARVVGIVEVWRHHANNCEGFAV